MSRYAGKHGKNDDKSRVEINYTSEPRELEDNYTREIPRERRNSGGGSRTPRRQHKKSNAGCIVGILFVLIVAALAVWIFYFNGLDTLGIKIPFLNLTNQSSDLNSVNEIDAANNQQTSSEVVLATATPEPTPEPTPTPTPEPIAPQIYDDGTDGYMSSGICIYNNKAFEMFYGYDEVTSDYASMINSFAEELSGVQVYNMVVPNHSEFGLPARVRDYYGASSQRQNTSNVYNNLSQKVKPVDVYDALNLHNNENIYYGTDTHWASLGAFYAYEVFCDVAGVKKVPLDSFEKTSYEGITGYLAYATGESVLYSNPDTIEVYDPKFSYTAEMSYDGLSFYEVDGVNLHDSSAGYSMFIWGDNACFRVTNNDLSTGRKLAIIKDSYGNAISPFLTASFDEVHVIDFRYFEANLPSYINTMGITDVLFFNNVMSANTYSQHDTMRSLFD